MLTECRKNVSAISTRKTASSAADHAIMHGTEEKWSPFPLDGDLRVTCKGGISGTMVLQRGPDAAVRGQRRRLRRAQRSSAAAPATLPGPLAASSSAVTPRTRDMPPCIRRGPWRDSPRPPPLPPPP